MLLTNYRYDSSSGQVFGSKGALVRMRPPNLPIALYLGCPALLELHSGVCGPDIIPSAFHAPIQYAYKVPHNGTLATVRHTTGGLEIIRREILEPALEYIPPSLSNHVFGKYYLGDRGVYGPRGLATGRYVTLPRALAWYAPRLRVADVYAALVERDPARLIPLCPARLRDPRLPTSPENVIHTRARITHMPRAGFRLLQPVREIPTGFAYTEL